MNLYLRVIFDRLKRYFISLLISLVIVGFVLFHDFKTNYVTIQIIEYDDSQEEKVILDEFLVRRGYLIELVKYDGNEITIDEIKSNEVVVSRRRSVGTYTPAPNGMYGGTLSEHYETVKENIPLDEEVPINKDEEAIRPGVTPEEKESDNIFIKFIKK